MQSRPLTTPKLQIILEKATGLPGQPEEGGGETTPRGETLSERASVKFPEDQVRTVDRVNMWVDAGIVYLRMWPAEIQTQYAPFYSNPTTVEASSRRRENPSGDRGTGLSRLARGTRLRRQERPTQSEQVAC